MGRLASLLKRKPKTAKLHGSTPKADDTLARTVDIAPTTRPPLSLSTSFVRGLRGGSHEVPSDKRTGTGSAAATEESLAQKVSLMDDIMEQLATPSPDTPHPNASTPISGFSDFGRATQLPDQLEHDPSTGHDDAKALATKTATAVAAAAHKALSSSGVAHGPPQHPTIEKSKEPVHSAATGQKTRSALKQVEERAHVAVKLCEASRKANAQLPSDDEGSDSEVTDSDGESVPTLPRAPLASPHNGVRSGPQQPQHHPVGPLHPNKSGSPQCEPVKKCRAGDWKKPTESEAEPVSVLDRMKDRHRAALAGNINHPNHPCNREEKRGNSPVDELCLPLQANPHPFSPALNVYSSQGMVSVEDFNQHASYHPYAQQPLQQPLTGYSAHGYSSQQLQQLQQHQQQLHFQQQHLLLQQQQLQHHIQQHVDAHPNSTRSPPRPSTRQSTSSSTQMSEESWPSGERPSHPRFPSQKSSDSGFGCSPEPESEKQLQARSRQTKSPTLHGDIDRVAEIISELCVREEDDESDDESDDDEVEEEEEDDDDDDDDDDSSDDESESRGRKSNRPPVQSPARTEEASATVVTGSHSPVSERDHRSEDSLSEDGEIRPMVVRSRRGSIQHGDVGKASSKLQTSLMQQTSAALAAASMAVAAAAAAKTEGLDYGFHQQQHQHQHQHQQQYLHPHRIPMGAGGAYPIAAATLPSPTTPTPDVHHHSANQPMAHTAFHHSSPSPISFSPPQISPYQLSLQHATAAAMMLQGHQHSYSLDQAMGGQAVGCAAHAAYIQQQNQQQQKAAAALRRTVSMRHPPAKGLQVITGQHGANINRTGSMKVQQQQQHPRQMRSRTTTESSKLSSSNSSNGGGPFIRGFAEPLPSVVQQQQLQQQQQQQQQAAVAHHYHQQGHAQPQQALHFPNHRMHPQQHPLLPSKGGGHPSPLQLQAQAHLQQLQQQQQQHPHHVAAAAAAAAAAAMHHATQPSMAHPGFYATKGPAAAVGQAPMAVTGIQAQYGYVGGGGVVHPSLAHSMEMHHHAQAQAAGLQAVYRRA
ncbi:hypothetical protein DFQ26_003790 [Actinomortierella ambigua]|nr:hypothetical protein DFQ26_003790 [Actinomortierella ambigua]